MAWIFQGNPKYFDVDDYVARYPELIYWHAPRYRSEIAIGDRAFIWRARVESGIVASGVIVEGPVVASKVKHPEALGNDLWTTETPNADDVKVGIALDTVRLSTSEGMLLRSVVLNDSLLHTNQIIRMPNGTVFPLTEVERKRIEELWASSSKAEPEYFEPSAAEGKWQLQAHRRRERSRFLVKKKIAEFRTVHGALYCEVCLLPEIGTYPTDLSASVFEVHHLSPLSTATTPRRTTLSDLAVICANCHRAIHATADVGSNLSNLKRLFIRTT
jgi:hypothetical protein